MPLGQRIAHMTPERRLSVRDLLGELVVGRQTARPRWTRGRSVLQRPGGHRRRAQELYTERMRLETEAVRAELDVICPPGPR